MEVDRARSTQLIHSPESTVSTMGEGDVFEVFGRSISKNSVSFFAQITVVYITVIACLINISLGNNSEVWLILLSASLGAVLPAPKLKIHKDPGNGPNPSLIIN